MNTGYENKFSQRYHIGTEAVAIDTPNASVSIVEVIQSY